MPRSTGTLVCAMLGQHPQLYGILETRLYEVERVSEWWEFSRDGGKTPGGLLRNVSEILFGVQSMQSVERAKVWLWQRRNWPTIKVLQTLATEVFPLGFVEKHPIPPASDQSIQEQLERRIRCFPEARFIWLVRCPTCFGQSMLEMLDMLESLKMKNGRGAAIREKSAIKPSGRTRTDPEVSWKRVNKQIMSFLQKLPSERYRVIRSEDLLGDADKHLKEITSWLGIRSDSGAIEEMKHPERSPFAFVGPSNALGGGDGKFFRNPALRVPSAHPHRLSDPLPWRRDATPLADDVKQLARKLGYH